jgi:hypothetical protein
MKYLFIVCLFTTTAVYSQLTIEQATENSVRKFHMGSYSYHEAFIKHPGYGAPLILTADGGSAAFGDGDEGAMLVKLDKTGQLQWKRTIQPKGDEMESQSVVQDTNGNFYVFILVYDHTKYRGGSERVVLVNKTGNVIWDKYLGGFTLMNNPTVSYLRQLKDGRIAMRGHVVTEKQIEGKDPVYHFWEGWINSKGIVTQKAGDPIDWSKPEWQDKFKPEL